LTRRVSILAVGAALATGVAFAGATSAASTRSKHCRPWHHPLCKTTRSRPKPPPLPSRLEVDENDQGQPPQPYSLFPSHDPVGAGSVQFNVYNFGQDAHTFAVVSAAHQQVALAQAPANQPDTAVQVSVRLAPGTYTLECTLPGHAMLGMRATLTVK
jgi:plastocyanin